MSGHRQMSVSESTSVRELADHIAHCSTSKEDLKKLEVLLIGCRNRNNLTLLPDNEGMYYDNDLDDPNTFYVTKAGGTQASIVHYAAIRGRGDILTVLARHNVNLHISCKDNMGHVVTPDQVATINGHHDSFQVIKPTRTSGDACILN